MPLVLCVCVFTFIHRGRACVHFHNLNTTTISRRPRSSYKKRSCGVRLKKRRGSVGFLDSLNWNESRVIKLLFFAFNQTSTRKPIGRSNPRLSLMYFCVCVYTINILVSFTCLHFISTKVLDCSEWCCFLQCLLCCCVCLI